MNLSISARALRVLAWLAVCTFLIHVPCGRSVTVRQLVEVIDINNVSVSPDGRLVAYRSEQATIERNGYDSVWYVQPIDGSAPPRRLADGGDILTDAGGSSLPEPAVWSADSRWIFFRAVHDARIDLWRAAADGTSTEQITRDAANVRAFQPGASGQWVDYSIGAPRQAVADAEQDEYDRGFHIDRGTALGDSLFRSGFHEGRLATQHMQDAVAYVTLLSDAPDRWKRLDLVTRVTNELVAGPQSPVTPSELKGIPGVAAKVSEDTSGRIAIASEQQGASPALTSDLLMMRPGRSSSRTVQCRAQACTGKRISGLVWRPGSDEVLFTVSERDGELEQSVFAWDVVSDEVRRVVRSRGQVSGGGRWWPAPCPASATALLCVAADADAPPRLERIDIGTGTRTVLFAPNQALAQDMKQIAPARLMSWTDSQGTRLTGQFFAAPARDGRPPPLFVVYYRCTGFLRGSVGDEWPLATFAGAGIAALCINAAPSDDDALVRYRQGMTAVEGAVALLAGQGQIDPGRVGMGGLSLGAEVTLWTSMHSDLLRATSISTPVISPNMSLLMSLGEDKHFARMQRYWQVGDADQTPERWSQLSPMSYLDRIHAPSLMQMSEQEYRYSLDYTIPLMRTHRADLYVFPDEPHQKFQPRHKLAVYQRNLDWFRFWLLDQVDTDLAKVAQYETWQHMKSSLTSMHD
jgi:dipeptidyl aminopeptidase/acylaminoacyl peptidase